MCKWYNVPSFRMVHVCGRQKSYNLAARTEEYILVVKYERKSYKH